MHHARFFIDGVVRQAGWTLMMAAFCVTGCSGGDGESSVASDSARRAPGANGRVEPGASEDSIAEPDESNDSVAGKTQPAELTSGSTDSRSAGSTTKSDNAEREDKSTAVTQNDNALPESEEPPPTKLPEDILEGAQLTPLNPQGSVLLDLAGKRVLLKAEVCLTQGLLEMLLCPKQTKEHESILSIDAKAYTIHTGLLAIGCTEGKAAKYDPDTGIFTPPSGQAIDVIFHWTDEEGNLHRDRGQKWGRHSRQRYYEAAFDTLPEDLTLSRDGNLRYDDMNRVIFWYGPMSEEQRDECLKMSTNEKFLAAIHRFHKESQARQMETDWVFVGSGFYEDGDSGKQYLAEGGYLICVANFSMAMMDIGSPSDSNGTESLSYEAWTERIPPRGSEVLIELIPRQQTEASSKEAEKPDSGKTSLPAAKEADNEIDQAEDEESPSDS